MKYVDLRRSDHCAPTPVPLAVWRRRQSMDGIGGRIDGWSQSFLMSTWRTGSDLTSLLIYDPHQRHRGQRARMSSMDVGIRHRIVTAAKNWRTAILTPSPTSTLLYLILALSPLLSGDNDVLVYRFPFHKRLQLSPAQPALFPPLHPTSLSVAAAPASAAVETCGQSNRCKAVEAGCRVVRFGPVSWSVGGMLRSVIDKPVHGWRRVVTSCMRVTLPLQPAPRVVM